MSQVNLLAIDLAKSVDTSTVSTKSADQEELQSANFSAMMAKHQEQESGKRSQQSGNTSHQEVTSEQAKVSDPESTNAEVKADKANTLENNTSLEDGTSELSTTESDDQAQLSVDENAEENIEQKPFIESKANSRLNSADDIAKQLLSFIAASDEVSTESVDGKLKAAQDNSSLPDKVVALKTDFTDRKNHLEGKVATSTSEVMKNTVENSDKINNSDIITEQDKTLKESVELKVTLDKTNTASITASEKVKSPENLTLTPTAQSVKEAILVENSLETDGVAALVDEKLKNTPVDAVAGVTTNARLVAEDAANKENRQTINVETKSSNNAELEKLMAGQNPAIKVSAEKAENGQTQNINSVAPNVAEITNDEVKNVAKHDQAAERAINQTINNRGFVDNNESADTQDQAKEQSTKQQNTAQQPLGKSDDEYLKASQKVVTEQDIAIDVNEKITTNVAEKSAVQSQLRETSHHQILSQQSLHYAEEQAIQSNIVKAAADSISVQSAKTAFNIQAETISINRKDFVDAVKDKVMVMINQKIRQLEIRLDPPELGSMHVKLNLQNEQAAVNFVVQNQQAKEALEQNLDKLKDMLAQTGVDVGDANIEQRNQQTDEGDEAAQAHNEKQGVAGQDADVEELTLSAANLYKASASGVDYYA